ncbi:fatty acyl-AMP ligase [Streptosporangium fragile]|uniref:Fatty acyl-AMP ligase n=1 Tax=Streptosporangium fragile TaxID=46186 RepID=A0ABN3VR77_9ACTN
MIPQIEVSDDLVRTLHGIAGINPDRPALTFVDYGASRDGVAITLSYGELDRRVRALAVRLTGEFDAGSPAAILCPHGPDYVVAFLGCLYAGLVAVPVFPPDQFRGNLGLTAILADCRPRCLLTTTAAKGDVAALPVPGAPPLVVVDEEQDDAGRWAAPDLEAQPLAYLQYTSGSTRAPSGVRITHRNLMTAVAQMRERWEYTQDNVGVSWLPYFHDMGLVSGIALPLGSGGHAVHLTPYAFIQRPYRWLRLISEYRADWSAAPNFALDLCVRRVTEEQKKRLDLSNLGVLCNGAEPIRLSSLEAFSAAFSGTGFTHRAHASGYGLAEATLTLTASTGQVVLGTFDRAALGVGRVRPCAEDDPMAWRIVSSGTPLSGVEVRVVDPVTRAAAPPGATGEIWARGPNIGDGYWDRPGRTAEVFGGRLAGADGRWLRTGDVGFLHEGELYVTGRIKDLIIVDGRNHYAADLEVTVERADPEMRPRNVAAFGVDGEGEGGERLVVLAELRHDVIAAPDRHERFLRAARRALATHHGVEPHDLVLVPPGALPRTTSGKVRRGTCRERYLDGAFSRPEDL